MAGEGRLANSLERTLSSTIVPYGYTVTVWISGAYLVRKQGGGTPGVGFGEGVAFAAGALLAFGALAALSGGLSSRPQRDPPDPEVRHPIFAAGLHVLAVSLAVGSSMLASSWLGSAAWFFAPFLATGVYLAVASIELAFALELSRRESRFAHGLPIRRARQGSASPHEAADLGDEAKAGNPGP